MKVLCIWLVLVCWFGFTNVWADEETTHNVLDKRVILYGGAEFYQADGKFGYVTDRFLVRGGAGGMSLKYGDWDGSLWFVNAYLEYWPFRYAGIGAGYKYLDANVDYDPGNKKETYDFALPGPVVYVTVGF